MVDVNGLNVIEDNVHDLGNESDPSEYFSDDSIDEEPNQDLEFHDVGEAEEEEEDIIDLPTYEEIIAELEEDAAEMLAYGAAQEAQVEQLQAEKTSLRILHEGHVAQLQADHQATKTAANDLMEVLERRWLDEAEKSYQLQLQLDAANDKESRLEADLARVKRKCCSSLFDLQRRVNDFPTERGKLGYNINKSVVTSMIHEAYNKAREF